MDPNADALPRTLAFVAIVAGLVLAPLGAWRLSRPGGSRSAGAAGLGFAGVLLGVLCARRPDLVPRAVVVSDLALLYPGGVGVAAAGLLAALASRTDARNRRAVLLFTAVVAVYFLFEASFLLRDPAAALGAGGHWKDRCRIQSTSWSCAPAAAVSLLRSLGIEATEAEMARLMRSRARRGSGLLLMTRALERKLVPSGRRADLRTLDYDALVAARAPGLLSIRLEWLMDHAVALVAADAAAVTILDPLAGERRLSRAELESEWRGDAILVVEAR